METGSQLYHYVWSEQLWFPQGLKVENSNRSYGWHDLENSANSLEYYPQIRDLNIGILLGVVLVGVRFILEAFVFTPIGHWLGIRRRRLIQVEPNPVLEAAYKQSKDLDEKTALRLSKQLDLPVRKVEIWFHNRRSKEKTPLIDKFCNNSWHLLFYTASFIYGCVILWDKPWLWKTKDCWNGWPTQHVSQDLYWYYVVELAFYCSLILTLFTDHRRKDFNEMIIHHVITVTLIYFSWVTNFVRIGSLILMLHDASDPWLAIAKMGVYFKKKTFTDVSFAGFVTTWTIPRMIYFPFWILNSTLFEVGEFWPSYHFGYYFFNIFLFSLFVLHVIWTHRLIKMVVQTLTGGEVHDSRSDDEDSEEIENNGTLNVNPVKSERNGVVHRIRNGTQNGSASDIANGHAKSSL